MTLRAVVLLGASALLLSGSQPPRTSELETPLPPEADSLRAIYVRKLRSGDPYRFLQENEPVPRISTMKMRITMLIAAGALLLSACSQPPRTSDLETPLPPEADSLRAIYVEQLKVGDPDYLFQEGICAFGRLIDVYGTQEAARLGEIASELAVREVGQAASDRLDSLSHLRMFPIDSSKCPAPLSEPDSVP